MSLDPMELVEADDRESDRQVARLNTRVACTVALLASFMAIGEVKSGNIVQGMQQAQAEKIDNWSWYQARNIRQEVLETAARQFRALAQGQSGPGRDTLLAGAARHDELAARQSEKKVELEKVAKASGEEYGRLSVRDDQFDLMLARCRSRSPSWR